MFKTLLVLVVAVCVANASVHTSLHETRPEKYQHQQGCYVSELDQMIPFEKSAASKSSCAVYFCTRKFIQYHSCNENRELPSNCRRSFDDGLVDYPFCCGTIICDLKTS